MDILNLMKEFRDQESCLRFIEEKRWKQGVCCIHCGSEKLDTRTSTTLRMVGIVAIVGLAFRLQQEQSFMLTRYLFRKWFLAISILSNAKKSISSCQLVRDLDMNQKSAW